MKNSVRILLVARQTSPFHSGMTGDYKSVRVKHNTGKIKL